jgi:hypothetical protein
MTVTSLPRATARPGESSPRPSPIEIDLTRLYRAHVSAVDWRGAERTAFVEASSHHAAAKKIAAAIAALEYRKPEEVIERVYNCASAGELIAEGLSDDHAVRLFETGWTGGKPTHFVEAPLVLVPNPGPLLRVWAQIPQPTND